MSETVVIINPKAGHGRAKKQWEVLSSRGTPAKAGGRGISSVDFLRPFEERYSEYSGHIPEVVRQSLKAGAKRILIVGGDGSLSEALNGFFEDDKPVREEAILGALPLGTGSDFLRTLGIFNIDQAIERLKKNRATPVDIGEIKSLHQPRKRLFLNIASFGCSGEVVKRVNALSAHQKKLMGGGLSYLWTTLSVFLTYKSPMIKLEIENQGEKRVSINNVFVCNGKYSGGGMLWGPQADPSDKQFDLMILKEMPKIQGLLNMRKVYEGRVFDIDAVERIQCREFAADSTTPVPIEADGDLFGTLPALFRIYPHRIKIWC